MLIWGGASSGTVVNTVTRFIPHLGIWEPLATTSTPAARTNHSAVWEQGSMLVFGGTDATYAPLSDIFEFIPPQTVYIYQHPRPPCSLLPQSETRTALHGACGRGWGSSGAFLAWRSCSG